MPTGATGHIKPVFKTVPTGPELIPSNISSQFVDDLFKCPLCRSVMTEPHS